MEREGKKSRIVLFLLLFCHWYIEKVFTFVLCVCEGIRYSLAAVTQLQATVLNVLSQ